MNVRARRLIWVSVLLAAGCAEPAKLQPPAPTPGGSAVEGAVQELGGREAWQNVCTVTASALVTLVGESGEADVSRQRHEMDLAAGVLVATGQTKLGPWRVRVTRGGRAEVQGRLFAARPELQTLYATGLQRLLHRAGGALNFVLGGETAGDRRDVVIDRQPMVRVAATGGSRPRAYYFAPDGGPLVLLTEGGDEPGQEGTVTKYTYQALPMGLVWPERICVYKIGDAVLVGTDVLAEVEYSDVHVRTRR